jgi:hypothetical protein
MIKTWTLFIFIFFPLFALSQQQSPRLISKKDSLMPGMSTSIPFSLQNNSQENKVYDISVTTSSSYIIPILEKRTSDPITGNFSISCSFTYFSRNYTGRIFCHIKYC